MEGRLARDTSPRSTQHSLSTLAARRSLEKRRDRRSLRNQRRWPLAGRAAMGGAEKLLKLWHAPCYVVTSPTCGRPQLVSLNLERIFS